jgi:exosortase
MDDKVGHEIAPARRADRGSLRALVALALVALAAACFHDAIAELVGIWSASPNESHGFLVAVLVPVLVWMQRGSLAHGERDGFGAPAVATFAIAIAAGVAASVAGASSVVAALLPAIVLSAVWVALGREALAALALPICFFWFAVPLWWILTPGLQWLTVQATTLLLAGAGIPAFVDGAVVKIPAGVFEIVGGCAGTNYLVVALTMATLIAFLQRASLREGLRLVAFAASIAIAMNWLRVTLLIAIGQATQMRSPLVSDHFWFGWALFGVALVPIVLRARTLGARHRHATARPSRPPSPDSRSPSPGSAGATSPPPRPSCCPHLPAGTARWRARRTGHRRSPAPR